MDVWCNGQKMDTMVRITRHFELQHEQTVKISFSLITKLCIWS